MSDILSSDNYPRIAMLSLHSCPLGNLGTKDTGGMSVYIREIAAEMARLGYSIDIFTREHSPHDNRIIKLAPGVRLVHLHAGKTHETVDKLELYPHITGFAKAVDDFRLKENIAYKLIFSHYWLSGVTGSMLASRWKVPHAVMFHTLAAVKNQLGIGEAEPVLRLQGEARVIENSDKIIVTTENEKNSIIDLYGACREKITVIPCGVNTRLFKPLKHAGVENIRVRETERLVLYVGRIEPLKGPALLLDSLALMNEMKNKDDNWHCLIVGGGDTSQSEISNLTKQAAELGISQCIDFPGIIPQEELVSYYNRADVLVVPSYYESFGLVALEALACGCPVVATDVGDLKNIIQPGVSGDVVDRSNKQALAEAIDRWINRPPVTPDEKQAISRSVSRFGWNGVAENLSCEFESMIPEACSAA